MVCLDLWFGYEYCRDIEKSNLGDNGFIEYLNRGS